MKLYIHDDGSTTCRAHAPFSLKAEINNNSRKRTYWTPRGTWEVATQRALDHFKKATGQELTCETCEPMVVSA